MKNNLRLLTLATLLSTDAFAQRGPTEEPYSMTGKEVLNCVVSHTDGGGSYSPVAKDDTIRLDLAKTSLPPALQFGRKASGPGVPKVALINLSNNMKRVPAMNGPGLQSMTALAYIGNDRGRLFRVFAEPTDRWLPLDKQVWRASVDIAYVGDHDIAWSMNRTTMTCRVAN